MDSSRFRHTFYTKLIQNRKTIESLTKELGHIPCNRATTLYRKREVKDPYIKDEFLKMVTNDDGTVYPT